MIKVVVIAIVCAILVIYLKSVNSELYTLALVGSGIIILSFVFTYLSQAYDTLNKLVELTGVDKTLFSIILKITAIGYIVQFGAGTIEDMGLKGLADKLVFAGKIIIFTMSLPVLYALINIVTGILQ